MSGGITAAVVGGAAVLGGAYMSSQAATGAANTQANAANQATAAQQAALQQQIALNKPFYEAGVGAVNKLAGGFNYQEEPGYAWTLGQGLKAMNATAAARGGLFSGNALAAGQKYGQGLGSTYYQTALDNYLKQNQFLANLGQNSANATGQNIGAFGNAQAGNITGAANAQAAGQIGSANAYTNAIGQGIGAYQMNQLINRSAYNNPSSSGGGNFATTDANSYGEGWGPTGYTG